MGAREVGLDLGVMDGVGASFGDAGLEVRTRLEWRPKDNHPRCMGGFQFNFDHHAWPLPSVEVAAPRMASLDLLASVGGALVLASTTVAMEVSVFPRPMESARGHLLMPRQENFQAPCLVVEVSVEDVGRVLEDAEEPARVSGAGR